MVSTGPRSEVFTTVLVNEKGELDPSATLINHFITLDVLTGLICRSTQYMRPEEVGLD